MSKVNISPVVSEAAMTSLQFLSELICERLSAAAEEIFRAFERTVVEYEEEVDRQRQLLELAWKPEVKLQRIELRQPHVHGEVLGEQERNSSLEQEEPESLQTKEETCTSQEQEADPIMSAAENKEGDDVEPDHRLLSPVSESGTQTRSMTEIPQQLVCNKVLTDQERNCSLDQEVPESLHVKQDQEEICISQKQKLLQKQEADAFSSTPVNDKMEAEPVTDHQLVSHPSPAVQTERKPADSKIQKRQDKKKSLKNPKTKAKTKRRIYKKSLKCDTCGILFSTHYQVKVHMRVHTGERPYSCEVCDKGFKRPYHLSLHMRTHTGEKPHACKTCGKAFCQIAAMKAHMRSHTGERPHFCEMCSKRFFQLAHLRNHLRTHTGERPFSCNKCDKTFSQMSTMKTHVRIHRDEKFTCDTCGQSFEQRREFKIHMKTHKDKKP